MKRMYLTMIAFFFAMVTWADTKPIDWEPNNRNKGDDGKRVPALIPHASHDNNLVNLYSTASIGDMQVVVKDLMGQVVYSCTISLASHIPFSFVLNEANPGIYILEVAYGSIHLTGTFEVEE